MSFRTLRLRDFLLRSKLPIDIEDNQLYKRVTIRSKHQGISLRDEEVGKKIGTKKQFVLKQGQFVLSKIDARYGAFGIAPSEVEGAIITGNFWAYDVDTETVSIDWLNQYTNSPAFYDLCERASSGITHRKYLDESAFLDHEVAIPDVNSQRQIAAANDELKAAFGKIFTEIDTQQTHLTSLRQAFLREAMQGQLVPQDPTDEPAAALLTRIRAEKADLIKAGKLRKEKPLPPISEAEIPYDLPAGWEWCRAEEIANVASGSTPSQDSFIGADGVPYLKVYNIVKQRVDFDYKPQYIKPEVHSATLKRSRVYPGDVLMNIVGPPLGKVAVVPATFPEWNINQALVAIRSYGDMLNNWIYYFLREGSSIEKITTKGVAGQDNISVTQSRMMFMPLPPLAEQHRIVAKLEQLLAQCDALEASIRTSRTHAEQLLQAALREALAPPVDASGAGEELIATPTIQGKKQLSLF